jgi:hypothetical protein
MRPSCHKYYYRPPTRTEAERTEYLKQFIVNCVSDLVRPGVCLLRHPGTEHFSAASHSLLLLNSV